MWADKNPAMRAAINDVRILGIDREMARFAAGGWFPIALANAAAIAAAQNPHRRVVLLRAIDAIRKVIVGGHPVKLRGRLVVISCPVCTRVKGNLSAAVIADDYAGRLCWIEPEIMMIAMRGTYRLKSFAAIG